VFFHSAHALRELDAVAVEEGHAEGVIAPVGDPLQGVEQNWKGISITGITNYPAHSNVTSIGELTLSSPERIIRHGDHVQLCTKVCTTREALGL
jgi:hypothetical protein